MLLSDYDKAVYYLVEKQWDNLFLLMIQTKDDFLSMRIHHFLADFEFAPMAIIYSHDKLLRYLSHAQETLHYT